MTCTVLHKGMVSTQAQCNSFDIKKIIIILQVANFLFFFFQLNLGLWHICGSWDNLQGFFFFSLNKLSLEIKSCSKVQDKSRKKKVRNMKPSLRQWPFYLFFKIQNLSCPLSMSLTLVQFERQNSGQQMGRSWKPREVWPLSTEDFQ